MTHAEMVGLTTTESEQTLVDMLVVIGYSLSDFASSDNGEDGEDKDVKETDQGKISNDDEPGWAVRTITKAVQQHMETVQ